MGSGTAEHPQLVRVSRLDLVCQPYEWAFARERRAEIDAHFAELRRGKPSLFNGRVLMLRDYAIKDDVFRGIYFETDFASFIASRDWGFPDPEKRNGFAMGALRAADGAFLLGVMGSHTANAGRIYFPAGTPDPSDRRADGTVDLAASVAREMVEETGLEEHAYTARPAWHVVFAGARIAFMRTLQGHQDASTLRAQILAHIGREQEPELADVRIVRSEADFDAAMPPFVLAYLRCMWATEA